MRSLEIAERYGIDLYRPGKVQCPKCAAEGRDNSGDNLVVYGKDKDGRHKGAHCFAGCNEGKGFTIPSEEWLEENGIEDEKEYTYVGAEFNAEIHAQLKENTTTDSRGYRGIRKDTTGAFGVRHMIDTNTGQVTAQLYPATVEAENDFGFELTGYKQRIHPKDFSKPYGETGKECHLFGQFKFLKARGKYCLIVGGEVDQLSAFQMVSDSQKAKGYDAWPVVSPTIGESGADKQVAQQYAWFDRFERVVICMDNDVAGRRAAEKIAKVLPKGKAFIMEMTRKDPNCYIYDAATGTAVNHSAAFLNEFYRASPYTPNGIVGSGSLTTRMKEAVLVPKIPLPPFMHKVQKMMAGGIPLGRIVNLGSASGTGKSTIVDECVFFWVYNSPHRIGVVSLESDVDEYGIKILSRKIGIKIDLIEDPQEKYDLLCREDIEDHMRDLFYREDGSHRWHLMDERDGGLDDLKEKIMHLVVGCDCKVIILDPLQDILDGMGNEEQAVFMRWQKGLTKSHKVTFININHVRKSGGGTKQNSAGAELFEEDFQGSSSIFKSGACNLLFMRNKEADNEVEQNVTRMKMTKCRWTGRTSSNAGMYFYDNPTHTLHDLDDYLDRNPKARMEYEAALAAREEG